jgi:3-methylfumaryl-CoA hydratase
MLDTDTLQKWLGRQRKDEDELALNSVRRLAAMLDLDADAFRRGDPLPESWYAILFGPVARQSTLAPDGHPATGDFLPPLHNTRRMFAGRRVRFHQPLRIGDLVQRTSTVERAEPKSGRSGSFVLVTVVHELTTAAGLAVTEEQDIVYREAAGSSGGNHGAPSMPQPEEMSAWSRTMTVDPVLLFRYSAITFNAHRIHYDPPYAREVEGYPGLVVNGGLTTLLLVETARPHLEGRIAGYATRAVRPLFAGDPLTLFGRRTDGGAKLWACGPNGQTAMQLDVALEGHG